MKTSIVYYNYPNISLYTLLLVILKLKRFLYIQFRKYLNL